VIFGAVKLVGSWMENKEEPRWSRHGGAQGLIVEVTPVELSSHRLDVSGHGTVIPAREIMLQPQVTGLITWYNEELVPGGLLREGDELIRVEGQDYRLRVSQARADLRRAEAGLETERGRASVAETEWEMFAEELPVDEVGRSLALREPQTREASAAVDAAESRVRQARTDLRRVEIQAPFNAFVREEAVDIGQLISPASHLATLVGTDSFWVQVSLPYAHLSRIAIPGVNATVGSRAIIRQELGGETIEREGRVIRLQYALEPTGRMAHILVEIDDPLGLAARIDEEGRIGPPIPNGTPPLLLGSYVEADFEGNRSIEAIELPRAWLREGDQVYLLSDDGTLDIRHVTIAWRLPETVLVSAGLLPGDRVVRTRIPVPVQGMRLRTPDDVTEGSGEGRGPGGHPGRPGQARGEGAHDGS
jgi:multidrug efflux pump subunit AcrA (membrane-fusion protein)